VLRHAASDRLHSGWIWSGKRGSRLVQGQQQCNSSNATATMQQQQHDSNNMTATTQWQQHDDTMVMTAMA